MYINAKQSQLGTQWSPLSLFPFEVILLFLNGEHWWPSTSSLVTLFPLRTVSVCPYSNEIFNNLIKNKSPEEIRELFGLEDDLTEDEKTYILPEQTQINTGSTERTLSDVTVSPMAQ
ncbi:skp1 family, dimerization domain-containing protein [Ditylenchus destructor]|nr:skp1 family, dimerization domain-containing protein [Ditylenchus destructor]